jgi:hypothetical protein
MSEFQVGQILIHTEIPELGRIRVEYSSKDHVEVLVERKHGGELKSFRLPNSFLTPAPDQSPGGFEAPKAAKKTGARKVPSKMRAALPFEGALTLFQTKYPQGFVDPMYIKDERAYKETSLATWNRHFSQEAIQNAKVKGDPGVIARGFQEVFKIIPMMHIAGEWLPFLNAVQHSPEAFTLASHFADAVAFGAFTEDRFNATVRTFETLGLTRPKWTVFTYWPYAATTRGFPFVKPSLIQSAAPGLGIALNYAPHANWLTYCQAIAVYEELWRRLQPLGARDWVDVQTFLWIGWKA